MSASQIEREPFGTLQNGDSVERYTLRGPGGVAVRLITYGATVTELLMPDAAGDLADVVLGFDNLRSYETQSPYFGCTVGRVAFRIPYGRFELDGRTYQLSLNRGAHHLHGGSGSFSWRVWQARPLESENPAIEFSLRSPDGDQGYPGAVQARVVYTLAGRELRIEFSAQSDRPTPLNMTHHGYFNLAGAGQRDVLQHVLQIDADRYSETDAETIPTGALLSVAGTPWDFTRPTPIGQRIGTGPGQVEGYDLAYLSRHPAGQVARVASLWEPDSGRRLDVLTDSPALILYTGNALDGSLHGKNGVPYTRHGGLALETGHLPDSVHHAQFPSVILRAGQTYRHTCLYRFGAEPAPR